MILSHKPPRQAVVIAVFVILALGILILVSREKLAQKLQTETLSINSKLIKVELSDSPREIYRGLSGRSSLCADCGMLFVFPSRAERNFVMRQMNFPLDIIFIDGGKIVKIYSNLAPEGKSPTNLYSSEQAVNQVLEVNAGVAAQNGWQVGSQVFFSK